MENIHLLLLQYLIATFEGQEEFNALTDEADRLIFEHVNAAPIPQADLVPNTTNLLNDEGLDFGAPTTPVNGTDDGKPPLPPKLAALAAMKTGPRCAGCYTPGVTKDENGNCEICGYPGTI